MTVAIDVSAIDFNLGFIATIGSFDDLILVLGNFAANKSHRGRVERISISEFKLELECLTLIDTVSRRVDIHDPSASKEKMISIEEI